MNIIKFLITVFIFTVFSVIIASAQNEVGLAEIEPIIEPTDTVNFASGEWIASMYIVDGRYVPDALRFERLVPNTQYAEWCATIAERNLNSTPCLMPHGTESTFVTDGDGNAKLSMHLRDFPPHSGANFFEIAIAYHGAGATLENPVWFNFVPRYVNPPTAYRHLSISDRFVDVGLSAIGNGRYTAYGDRATSEFIFEGLVPNAEYSLWCVAITQSITLEISEQPCS